MNLCFAYFTSFYQTMGLGPRCCCMILEPSCYMTHILQTDTVLGSQEIITFHNGNHSDATGCIL